MVTYLSLSLALSFHLCTHIQIHIWQLTCWVRGALFFVARWQAFCLILFGNKKSTSFWEGPAVKYLQVTFQIFQCFQPQPPQVYHVPLGFLQTLQDYYKIEIVYHVDLWQLSLWTTERGTKFTAKTEQIKGESYLGLKVTEMAWAVLLILPPRKRKIHNQYSLEESCVLYVVSIFICNMFFISICRLLLRYSPEFSKNSSVFWGVPWIRLDFLDAHWMLKWRAEHATNPRNSTTMVGNCLHSICVKTWIVSRPK